MRIRRGRRLLAAGLGAVLLLTGTGCSLVPVTGTPVRAEEETSGDPLSEPFYRIIAAPPKQGGTPQEILEGFQAAMAAVDDPQRKIARQYLTGDAARTWNPAARVTVYTDTTIKPALVRDDQTSVELTFAGEVAATIDAHGRYLPAEGAPEKFGLTKVGGEWRISAVPPGLHLSQEDVNRAYRPLDLYFPDQHLTGLVVERVQVPIDPWANLATSLVRRLLAGPSGALQRGVHTAFPEGTRLNRVVADQGTVVVDFNAAILGVRASRQRFRAMQAQLAWTLREFAWGQTIEVQVDGEPWPDGELRIDPKEFDSFTPDVLTGEPQGYYMKGGRLYALGEGREVPVPGAAGHPGGGVRRPAISADGSKVAALSAAGVVVTPLAGDSAWETWITGTDLTAPSWDRYDFVWAAERLGRYRSRIWRAGGGTGPVQVQAPELEETEVRALKVARDGVRVAAVTDDGSGLQVRVGVVEHGRDRIGFWHTLVRVKAGEEVVDVAWEDGRTLLVLIRDRSDTPRIVAYSVVDGAQEPEERRGDRRIQTITAAPGGRMLAGADEDGEVLAWNPDKKEEGWVTVVEGGAVTPVYPLG